MYTLEIGTRFSRPCNSFAEASALYCALRDESGEGVSTFPEGKIRADAGGRTTARVSYNGKVWPRWEWQPTMTPLFDPYAVDGEVC